MAFFWSWNGGILLEQRFYAILYIICFNLFKFNFFSYSPRSALRIKQITLHKNALDRAVCSFKNVNNDRTVQ